MNKERMEQNVVEQAFRGRLATHVNAFVARAVVNGDPLTVDDFAWYLTKALDGDLATVVPFKAPRIRYANSKLNTRLNASRIGSVADDTFRVTVYRDGVPDGFTTHEARLLDIVAQFEADGFVVVRQAGVKPLHSIELAFYNNRKEG